MFYNRYINSLCTHIFSHIHKHTYIYIKIHDNNNSSNTYYVMKINRLRVSLLVSLNPQVLAEDEEISRPCTLLMML